MKILILNDQHWGFKNDSPIFLEYFASFYDTILFPYLESHKDEICAIVSLGDLFDRRKYINFQTFYKVREVITKLASYGPKVFIIPGNHDVMFRNTNRITSLSLLQNIDNVQIVEEVQKIDDMLFVPWINEENHTSTIESIANTDANLIMGHFEINGFSMVHGVDCLSGLDKKLFSRFKRVFSGHFHTRQQKDNITYCGTQYQMNFGDEFDVKGFNVYDPDTDTIEFIENPQKLFFTIIYDETKDAKTQLAAVKKRQHTLEKSYIKIITKDTDNPVFLDSFLEEVYKYNPSQVLILRKSEYELTKLTEKALNTTTNDEEMDTLAIIHKEIDGIANLADPENLKSIFGELYQTALLVQNGDTIT